MTSLDPSRVQYFSTYLCQLCLRYKADEDEHEKAYGGLPAQVHAHGSIVSRHSLRYDGTNVLSEHVAR